MHYNDSLISFISECNIKEKDRKMCKIQSFCISKSFVYSLTCDNRKEVQVA